MNDCVFSKMCIKGCKCIFYISLNSDEGDDITTNISSKMRSSCQQIYDEIDRRLEELEQLEIELLKEEFLKVKNRVK